MQNRTKSAKCVTPLPRKGRSPPGGAHVTHDSPPHHNLHCPPPTPNRHPPPPPDHSPPATAHAPHLVQPRAVLSPPRIAPSPPPPPASRRSPPPTTGADPRRTYRRDDAAEGAAQQHRIGGVHEHGGHRRQRAGQRWGTGGERGKETAAPRAARRARVAVGEEAGYCLCTWTVTLGQQTHTRTAAASPVGCDGDGIKRASG